MKKLFTYFVQGLLLVAPIFVTGYIVYKIFQSVDGLLNIYIEKYLGFNIPGMGVLLIFIILVLLGIAGGTILARPIKKIVAQALDKLPFLKLIYSSINDLFSAIVGKERKFHHPVLVQINKENGLWKIGFITNEAPIGMGLTDVVAVYFPHSYAFSGEIYIVPNSSIKQISMRPTEAMKFIISGGVSGKGIILSNKYGNV
jgi:uncharacterized membrane protein